MHDPFLPPSTRFRYSDAPVPCPRSGDPAALHSIQLHCCCKPHCCVAASLHCLAQGSVYVSESMYPS
jgi:hypothetical protein